MTQRSTLYLSLIALFLLIVLYTLSSTGMLGDNPVGQTARDSEPLVVPAGYAFSIWGLIYLGLAVFPIFQFVKKRTGHELWKKVRIWYALNVVANGLWLAFASYDWLWTTVLIILFMLWSLVRINDLLIRIRQTGGTVHYWTEQFVFSIYFAWITLATALNISSALAFYDWNGFDLSELTWAIMILPSVALIAIFVFLKYRDNAFGAVVIWAYIALAVRHFGNSTVLFLLSIAVTIAFILLIVTKGGKWPESSQP